MTGKRKARAVHPRNRYAESSPDFAALAARYPSFARYVRINSHTGRGSIDWTDYNATRELTRVLLESDYGIRGWSIPDGQLCPAVTNRANYIHWIEDLLQEFPAPWKNGGEGDEVLGLDIGTGASVIYPLLGASLQGWKFVATDITAVALESGKKNVDANPHLAGLIELRSAAREGGGDRDTLLVGAVKEDEKFDFSMSNPPFFESLEEAGRNPKTACGGTPEEMVCEGGEAGFVSRMVKESVEIGNRVHWYTSMVGKKSSLKLIKAEIRDSGAAMVKMTEFVQGKTSRWGIAWTFSAVPTKRRSSSLNTSGGGGGFSFVLDGIDRRCSALEVLNCLSDHLLASGVAGDVDAAGFAIAGVEFKVTLFQQCPGSLLVKTWISKAGRGNNELLLALDNVEDVLTGKFSLRTD